MSGKFSPAGQRLSIGGMALLETVGEHCDELMDRHLAGVALRGGDDLSTGYADLATYAIGVKAYSALAAFRLMVLQTHLEPPETSRSIFCALAALGVYLSASNRWLSVTPTSVLWLTITIAITFHSLARWSKS
jgi:hypothetical protein